MIATELETLTPAKTALKDDTLNSALRSYLSRERAYVWRHGRRKTAEDLGVSRHTLRRFLKHGHMGRPVPNAALNAVGGSVRSIEAATQEIIIDLTVLRPRGRQAPVPGDDRAGQPAQCSL